MASETENLAGGYWADVAELFIRAQLIKPFFGRPYLRLGQCFALWGSHFELGGMLAAKHRDKLDTFVDVFLGMGGKASAPGAAERFVVAVAKRMLDERPLNSMNQWDYVAAHLGDRAKRIHEQEFVECYEEVCCRIYRHVRARLCWNSQSINNPPFRQIGVARRRDFPKIKR